jgi:protein-S-isoprenylcysteine O-methyltransferase Ste14
MGQLVIFAAISIFLATASRSALRDPRSHGFYRFFAWEALAGLLVLNAPAWFRDPFSPLQIVSWMMLLISIVLAVHGFWMLIRAGRPVGSPENTTALITSGAYRLIRHPLYSSLLWLGWGAFCKQPSPPSTLLTLVMTAFLVATAKVEEAELLGRFGAAYEEYRRRTRMFIPYVL